MTEPSGTLRRAGARVAATARRLVARPQPVLALAVVAALVVAGAWAAGREQGTVVVAAGALPAFALLDSASVRVEATRTVADGALTEAGHAHGMVLLRDLADGATVRREDLIPAHHVQGRHVIEVGAVASPYAPRPREYADVLLLPASEDGAPEVGLVVEGVPVLASVERGGEQRFTLAVTGAERAVLLDHAARWRVQVVRSAAFRPATSG